MRLITKVLFSILFLFFAIHLLRDILQIFDVNTPLATVMRTNHLWCRPYCDYATLPHELFGIVGSFIVLRRNKVGLLGIFVLLSLLLWPMGFVMATVGIK